MFGEGKEELFVFVFFFLSARIEVELVGCRCIVTFSEKTQTEVVRARHTIIWTGQDYPTGICLFVGCLMSQQHASVSQGRICSDSFTCCHTEIEVADPIFYLTRSQYTDTGPTGPSAD